MIKEWLTDAMLGFGAGLWVGVVLVARGGLPLLELCAAAVLSVGVALMLRERLERRGWEKERPL